MKERMISRGDLFYYDFGERVGSVQSGERPVLVVQADDYNKNAPTVIVAAVTSKASCKVHRAVYDRLTEVLEQLKRLNNGNEIDDELLENIKLITNIIEGLYQKK